MAKRVRIEVYERRAPGYQWWQAYLVARNHRVMYACSAERTYDEAVKMASAVADVKGWVVV